MSCCSRLPACCGGHLQVGAESGSLEANGGGDSGGDDDGDGENDDEHEEDGMTGVNDREAECYDDDGDGENDHEHDGSGRREDGSDRR